jgi:hypothetical protein
VAPWRLGGATAPGRDLRLDRLGHGVQEILNLACLRPQLVQRTRVIACIVGSPSVAEWALVAKMVAGSAAYLRHGCEKVKEREGVEALRAKVGGQSWGFGSEALHSRERPPGPMDAKRSVSALIASLPVVRLQSHPGRAR